ncbi:MAG: response regulator [Deltaproteobacteria bacterium]|nr:MAG: response regulator [Deltaproteobacteria bacterium]
MGIKVLIVDDAAFMRNMIKDILEEDGYEVAGEAANGEEAISKYKELMPDIVTMDIVMPMKSGIEAVQEIVSFNKDAKIVICSALGQESLVEEAIEAGAKDFITKPFKKENVLNIIKKLTAS